jgi:hypothetical protein
MKWSATAESLRNTVVRSGVYRDILNKPSDEGRIIVNKFRLGFVGIFSEHFGWPRLN